MVAVAGLLGVGISWLLHKRRGNLRVGDFVAAAFSSLAFMR